MLVKFFARLLSSTWVHCNNLSHAVFLAHCVSPALTISSLPAHSLNLTVLQCATISANQRTGVGHC